MWGWTATGRRAFSPYLRKARLTDERCRGTLDEPGLNSADLVAPQGVGGEEPPLEAGDVEDAALDVHLHQHEAAGHGDPEPMAKHQQD